MALVWSFLANLLTFAVLLHAQPGFLSIDCGIAEGLNYTDDDTKIFYTSDTKFIDTGTNKEIEATYITQQTLPRQYQNLRFFPDGTRNCYTLTPVIKNNRYLLRASFMYGNYDGLDQPPQFGAYVGVNPWDINLPSNSTQCVRNEIIMVASLDYISVCLVNTGLGIPFISTLELRLLNNNSTYMVASMSQSLRLNRRAHFRSNYDGQIRFPDDAYDRIWYPWGQNSWVQINTTGPINFREDIGYKPPAPIMNSGVMSFDLDNLSFYFPTSNIDPTLQYYVYMHFAELDPSTQSRQFNFYIDGHYSFGPFSPEYLSVNTIVTSTLSNRDQHVIDLCKTTSSVLPPILNAMEIFFIQQLLATPTDSKDVDAIMSIKTAYEIRRNWMGDPCVPLNYIWEGLNCSYPDSKPPTIISLDLSSSRLTDEISTLLANLTSIQSLDVSNNSLTGPVPDFLAKLPSLKFLNLSNNNLTGTIPTVLEERSKKGSLSLSIDNNPHLVGSSIVPVNNNIIPCQGGSCKKRRKTVVHIVAPVILALIMLIVMVYVFRRINQRRRQRDPVVEASNASGPLLYADQQITSPEDPVVEANNTGGPLLFQHQQITSSDANHVVEAHRTGSPLLFEVQQITSTEDPVEESNNTGDALLKGQQIISTNGGSFIYEDPQNISAADTVAGASQIGGSLPSENQQVTSAEDPVVEANIIGCPLLLEDRRITAPEDPVVNETGSSLLSEDQYWITCPEDPVVKANETGSSLLSKNRLFTYDEVRVITNDFKRFLGKGAFGKVYYGKMTDGTELAVKKLFPQSVKLLSDLSKQIFENEAQLLMRAHHRNVVPFIGYCKEGDNMALIYEYMAQGNLRSHLLGENSNSKALNWDRRLHIGLDVAQGLEYLHDGCNPPIIHRDIKTANILLNERLEAKIGDFGLSKVFLKYDESSHISTGIKGTEGYIDPEYNTSKHLTMKSDVYSFGVVLFQLITALPATIGTDKIDLVDWANRTIAQAPIEGVVDPKLDGIQDFNSLEKAAEIARLCTSEKSEQRPTMCEVVAKLKDCLETETAAKRTGILVNIEQPME